MAVDPSIDARKLSDEAVPSNSKEDDRNEENNYPSFNIVPDPKYYVIRPDDIFSKLKRLIETSHGGVIGLTGVRGAGKSVLLRKIKQEFKNKHYTLQITAPTSSNEEMAFFMMLYHQLCDSIFSTINEKVFGKRFDALNVGLREFRSRTLRFKLVMVAAAIIFAGVTFMGFHGFVFNKTKDLIDEYASEIFYEQKIYVTKLIYEIEKKRDSEVEHQNQKKAHKALVKELASQEDRTRQNLKDLQVIIGLNKQEQNLLSKYIDKRLIPHPAVIAYYEIVSEDGFDYERNFLEPRELFKYFSSAISGKISKEKIFDQIKVATINVRNEIQNLKKSDSWSALLTTITDSGRAEFMTVENAIIREKERLTDLISSLQKQLSEAQKESSVGEKTSIDELIRKQGSLLEKIHEEQQRVTKAFTLLWIDLDSVEFHPMKISTWTAPRLPTDLPSSSESEISGRRKTINDSITDITNAMAKFFQFLDTSVEKDSASSYAEIFRNADQLLRKVSSSTAKYRYAYRYVPYLVLGLIVILVLGGLSILIRVTWSRAREARRNKHELGLIKATEKVIRMLEYNITRSRGAQVQVPLLQKITGSFSFSEQEQERSLTLPGLTTHYVKYIQEVQSVLQERYGSRKIIICIDELDKITDPEQIGNVLREIKGAFYIEDCFYLISISEDAVRAFDDRFVDERDIFESTFDEVIFLERLSLETCEKVAFRRIEKVGYDTDEDKKSLELTEAIWIASVVSAGVPRELLRNMRVIVTEKGGIRKLEATSAWHALFKRKLFESFEKVRAAFGLEDLRAELIEDIERLIFLIGTAVEEGGSSTPVVRFDRNTTSNEISNLEKRISLFAEKLEYLSQQWKKGTSEVLRAELNKQIDLIKAWQRNWLELLIYLYLRKANLRHSGAANFKKACKELLDIYTMLPYSFERSRKLLVGHATQ